MTSCQCCQNHTRIKLVMENNYMMVNSIIKFMFKMTLSSSIFMRYDRGVNIAKTMQGVVGCTTTNHGMETNINTMNLIMTFICENDALLIIHENMTINN